MASAYYSNTTHIDFASVLAMENPGMVSVFNALMASVLEGFLGCPTMIYESDLVDFFNNGSVRDGLVVSTVNGVPVEISEQLFAENFELPVNGLADLSEMPKDKIFDARSIVSMSREPVSLSGRKGQMKIEYRLLCDIMAKAISVKEGSFNALTVEKFSLLTAVVCGIRMNWASIMFNILKKMVSAGSKQAKGFAVQISLLLESIPNLELGESTEFPASKILTDKTVHRYISFNDKVGVEEAADAPPMKKAPRKPAVSTKRPAIALAEERNLLSNQQLLMMWIQVLSETAQSESTEGKQIEELDIRGSAIGSQAAVEEKHWFDLPYEDLIARWDAERPVVTASDTDEEGATMDVGIAGGDQQVQCSEEEPAVMKTNDDLLDADAQMSLEDILLTIPVDVPLPSAGMEITKITLGKTIKIPGVDEKTKYLASLPQIPADDKGKEILVERNPVKGNPAKEHYFLICSDIDLLVHLRAQVIEAVDQFFYSFSFKKLATINIEELSRKEEQVLIWGETEITHVALSRKRYILLKYRGVFVNLHLFVLEELREQALAHGLKWTRTCCSKIVEGRPRDRGAIIARTNTNTPSTCWLRTMIRVDGVWVVEPFCDQWVKIPRPVLCTEVSKQRSFVDFFPTMSEPLRILRKRWADICLEIVEFCASRRLLPVGSLHFCRSLSVVEPVFRVAARQSPVFALRVSQFCSVFVDFSLFSWLPPADITDLLSSIALDRTAFRGVQIAQERTILRNVQSSVLVAPSVQLSLDQRQSSHISSSDGDPTINFTSDDVQLQDRPADNRTSLPASYTDFSEAIDDLKTYLAQSIADSQNDILSKINTVAGRLREDLQHHENTVRAQVNNSCQDTRLHINGLIVNMGEYRKGVQTFGASVKSDNLDIQRKFDAQQAKLDDLDTQIAAMRNDQADAAADYFVKEPVEEIETEAGELSADEAKSVEDILMTIPVDVQCLLLVWKLQRLSWARTSKFQKLMKVLALRRIRIPLPGRSRRFQNFAPGTVNT
ncbi:dystroglycan-like [Dorcoceras hygrometricum]|uniref:Dystroglycan-like n=1 Tax=Dorcoceras hygrometricum TaxID=472368 RepID=A0A2Z7D9A4_9LAMI|nr:dystroglycan-like [Dorcoceras hygrometricum]